MRVVIKIILPIIVLSIAVLWISCGKKPSAVEPISGFVISPDSVQIYYQVEGTGKPALVFVHGWGLDGTYWSDQVKQFSSQYKVVTVDLAGHGNRDPTGRDGRWMLMGRMWLRL